jgi:hypothetical protein
MEDGTTECVDVDVLELNFWPSSTSGRSEKGAC